MPDPQTSTSHAPVQQRPPLPAAARPLQPENGGGGQRAEPGLVSDSPRLGAEQAGGRVAELPPAAARQAVVQMGHGFGNQFVNAAVDQAQTNPSRSPGGAGVAKPDPAAPLPSRPVELKTAAPFAPPAEVDQYLAQAGSQGAALPAQFGSLARGMLVIKRRQYRQEVNYFADRVEFDLLHPFFIQLAQAGLLLKLSLWINQNKVGGRVVTASGARLKPEQIADEPHVMGLGGFDLDLGDKLVNQVENGKLEFGFHDVTLHLARVFRGKVSLKLVDETLTFDGMLTIDKVRGLDQGTLILKRLEDGSIEGDVDIDVTFSKSFSGKVQAHWSDETLIAEGRIRYSSEKLNGLVVLRLMDKDTADEMVRQRRAPPEVSPEGKKAKAPARKRRKGEYALAGEGTLDFAFNEWLVGSAQVIVDPQGHVTVIGEIHPPAQFEFLPYKPYRKTYNPFEARASYGLPYVADVHIKVGITFALWAELGPGVLKDIKVGGTYSTDPQVRNNFRLEGVIHIQAAAGVDLGAYADGGLSLLGHDIDIGAGITGTLGIRGYAEAKPVIGYREEDASTGGAEAGGGDKKGIFFLHGELELAAQAYLGLKGDFHIKLDSPFWSPAPDKTWTWPLFDKEWPLGSSIGIGADVDYVFGSGKWPSVNLTEPQFDGDKFVSDIVHDRTQAKSAEQGEKPGKWKEKNTPDMAAPLEPPAPKGGLTPGKPHKPQVKSPPIRQGKKDKPKVPPSKAAAPQDEKDAERALAHQAEQRKEAERLEKLAESRKKDAAAGQGASKSLAGAGERDEGLLWQRGVTAIRQALAYADREGIGLEELNRILRSVRRRPEYGFTDLHAVDGKEVWIVVGTMSPEKEVTRVKKKKGFEEEKKAEAGGVTGPAPEAPKVRPIPGITIGEELGVPYKGGRTRAQALEITDEFVKIIYHSKAGGAGDVTQWIRRPDFERLVASGEVIRWTQERQRLMDNRPRYKKGMVEKVWEQAQNASGKVFDPHTGEELKWDKSKDRTDQWHMGHRPGKEYAKLVDSFVSGEITWKEFLAEYHDPKNYWPEHPLENVSHRHEE